MKLKHKIFISMLTTTCLVLLFSITVMRISISHNFIEFVNEVEFNKLKGIREQLAKNYQKHSGWDTYRGNIRAWHEFLFSSGPTATLGTPHKLPPLYPENHPDMGPPLPMDPNSLHRRLSLFDADKQHIVGERGPSEKFDYYPIVLSGLTIGWLGLEHNSGVIRPLELEFMKKQTHAFYIVGAGAFLLALLISHVVANHLLSPIHALAKGTRAMREIDFDTRIEVKTKDELGDLAHEFNLMAQTLKQYEELRKNWISDISHELRTPVTVILSKVEALQDGVRQPTPDILNSLHNDIMRLGKTINELHLISMMDSESLAVKLEPVDILKTVKQSLDTFLIRFEHNQIQIQREWSENCHTKIKGDAELLHRVFVNLFENTLKYTDSPGTALISCSTSKTKVILMFADSAPGIPEGSMEAIFDRLYRVDQSRNRALGGSGLGLSICRQIIGMHHGTITAENSPLGGLMIKVELPLA
ncbi:ATP-binding protein [Desulfovibrio sp. JC022]|uniref:ATP-binding protein n=1 Tax=Desulfovibrio sp. JC022 TaxID=2593642 RepID=UPI0013D50D67|nr:ATP-binding protein [Desulfovibrio sp. JC022]